MSTVGSNHKGGARTALVTDKAELNKLELAEIRV
jgi:hypothetical protein